MSSADFRRKDRRWSAARIAGFSFILVLLAVGFLPSLNAGVRQSQQIRALEKQNAATQDEIDELEKRRDALNDPEHIKKLARERDLYADDGETVYIVVGENGEDTAADQANKSVPARPWYREMADFLWAIGASTEDG